MSPTKAILTAGFAMFSMFFGSGNLVFPLHLGQMSLDNYMIAILGLIVTAVLVPSIGLLGMLLFDGDRGRYFSNIGKKPAFALTALMLCLMGPFGIIPRCIGVSFGGIVLMFPDLPLWIFSALFCACITVLVWNPNRVVEIIGVFLTPFKLGGIALLITIGLWFGGTPDASQITPQESFITGISKGYQTMDLLAALFFAGTIIHYLRLKLSTPTNPIAPMKLFKYGLYACTVGCGLLTIAYSGFVILGAEYGTVLSDTTPESLLGAISGLALGNIAIPIVGFTVAISCLTTATILATLFSEFIQVEILKEKISYHAAVILTGIATFAMSLLGFETIVSIIGLMLGWMYPLLILYAMFKIVEGLRMRKNDTPNGVPAL